MGETEDFSNLAISSSKGPPTDDKMPPTNVEMPPTDDKIPPARKSRDKTSPSGSSRTRTYNSRWNKSPDRYRPRYDRHRRSRSRSRSPRQDSSSSNYPSRRNRNYRRNWRRRSRSRSKDRNSNRNSNRNKFRVPDNWSDVPKMGRLISGTQILAIRVPLDENYTSKVKEADRWTPADFIAKSAEEGLDVGMVIDLTNTARYYSAEKEFDSEKIQYVKLPAVGFTHSPCERVVQEFIGYVTEFVEKNPTKHIAVHCTHGLNRTGFVIVKYLIEKKNKPLLDALALFNEAREPGIVKHSYIADLFQMHLPEEEIQYPELPAWAQKKYSKC